MTVAEEIGQMVSYAFLKHRNQGAPQQFSAPSDYAITQRFEGVSDEQGTEKTMIRREAFVEWMLEYLLRTENGARVLLGAVLNNFKGLTPEDYDVVVHSRQSQDSGLRPDFEITYLYTGNDVRRPEGRYLKILLEIKVGAPLSPDQQSGYPKLRADRENSSWPTFLVSLSTTWNPVHFSELASDYVQALTYSDLAAAARETRAPAGGSQPELWEFLEATAEGLQVATPPLCDVYVLDDRKVAEEMENWLALFGTLANMLSTEAEATPWGFSTRRREGTPFEADVQNDRWGIDFGECGYWSEEDDDFQRTPIWFSKAWIVWPSRIGLGADDSDELRTAMESFRNHRLKSRLQEPSAFVGRGSSRNFEFARQILWNAMHLVATIARKAGYRSVGNVENGLRFTLTGSADVVANFTTRDEGEPRLRFCVDGIAVRPGAEQAGGEYLKAIAETFRKALSEATVVLEPF